MGLEILDDKKKDGFARKAKEVCKRYEDKDTSDEINRKEYLDRVDNRLQQALSY